MKKNKLLILTSALVLLAVVIAAGFWFMSSKNDGNGKGIVESVEDDRYVDGDLTLRLVSGVIIDVTSGFSNCDLEAIDVETPAIGDEIEYVARPIPSVAGEPVSNRFQVCEEDTYTRIVK